MQGSPVLKRRISIGARWILWFLLGAATVGIGVLLLSKAWMLLQGDRTSDAYIYWQMGRAILNGRRPYADIFESKPPGIFLLSALSFAVTGGPLLGYILNALIMLAVPLLLILAVQSQLSRVSTDRRRMPLVLAGLFGGLLSLYMGSHANGWQNEFYGAFFGIVYVVSIVRDQHAPSRASLAGATIGMLGSIGFKEPFFLLLVASALLLLKPSISSWWRLFLLPLLLSAAIGFIGLVLLGSQAAYFTVYLRSMLGQYIVRYDPLWYRAVNPLHILESLTAFSPLLLLLIGVLIVLACFPNEDHGARKGGAWVHYVLRPSSVAIALMLSNLAVGIGGDYQMHHFVFAVPLYAALFVSVHRLLFGVDGGRGKALAGSLALLVALTCLTTPVSAFVGSDAAGRVRALRAEEATLKRDAHWLDALLDRCGIQRYFSLKAPPVFAFTRHSPENFFTSSIEHLTRYHTAIGTRGIDHFMTAQILVLGPSGYQPDPASAQERAFGLIIQSIIDRYFTAEPTDCVRAAPVPGYTILLRRPGMQMDIPSAAHGTDE